MNAFGWGTLAASSLVVGGVVALVVPIGRRTLGLVMAFGVAVLTSAVAYELVEESFETSAWGVTCLAAGYTFFDADNPGAVAFANAFAGGAVLTMLADTMAPEAYANGGRAVGLVTTVGFLGAFLLHALT